jgi:glycosyltransferase involved in cell wall biosynthesis
MTPVPILYVIPRMAIGGAQRHLVEVLRRLDRRRFAPALCCLATDRGDAFDLLDEVRALDVPIVDAGLRNVANGLIRPHTLAQVVRVAGEARRRRVQVVHSYLHDANWFGTLAGRLAGVPAVIVSKRSMDVYARRRDLSVCRVSNRLAHRVTAVAEAVREHVHRVEGCPREKITVIPNGVDADQFTATPAAADELRGLAGDGRLVGTITRLVWKRGHEQLLQAAGLIATREPGARLLVVGDGPLRPKLEAQARDIGLNGAVRFLGAVPRAARLLPHLDVFVLSSVWEGMSNGLLEAMAAGRPVVATRVGGNPEVVVDGQTGLLVPPGDAEAMADAVLRLLRDAALAQRMGQAARRRVEAEFTLPRMVRRMEDLYDELLARRAA